MKLNLFGQSDCKIVSRWTLRFGMMGKKRAVENNGCRKRVKTNMLLTSFVKDAKGHTCCIIALSRKKDTFRHNCNLHVFGLPNEAEVPGGHPTHTQRKHASSTQKGSGQICIHDLLVARRQGKPSSRCVAQICTSFFELLMQLLLFGWDCPSSQHAVEENNDPQCT